MFNLFIKTERLVDMSLKSNLMGIIISNRHNNEPILKLVILDIDDW